MPGESERRNSDVKIIDIGNLDIRKIDRLVVRAGMNLGNTSNRQPSPAITPRRAPSATRSHLGSTRSGATKASKVSQVSPSLMKTTASFQSHIESKEEEAPEDIWYSERNASLMEMNKAQAKQKYSNISSKLYAPTQSAILKTIDDDASTVHKEVKEISPHSRILMPTTSQILRHEDVKTESQYNEDFSEISRSIRPINEESHLLGTTAALKNAKWKSKQEIELEESIRAQIEKEEREAKETFKVLRPSERLLLPTAAHIHSQYRKNDDVSSQYNTDFSDTVSEDVSNAFKVKETSESLLKPTKGQIHGKYKPKESPVWVPKPLSPVSSNSHLVSPTAGLERAKYKKPEKDVDAREIGWKTYGRRLSDPVSPTFSSRRIESPITPKNSKKVAKPSDRLVVPNAHSVWKGPESEQTSPRNLTKVKPISPNDHLLKPREAPKPVEEVSTPTMKITKVSDRLLAPTVAVEAGKYVKPEDRVVVEEVVEDVKDAPTLKVKETSDRLLTPTAAVLGHRKPEPETPKETPKPQPVATNEHFLQPTKSYKMSITPLPKPNRVIYQIPEEGATPEDASYLPQVSPSAHFLAPTASFINRVENSDGVYVSPRGGGPLKKKNSLGDMWLDAVSTTDRSSVRSGSPSILSMQSSTPSSISVKNLVKAFTVRAISKDSPKEVEAAR